MPKPMKCPTNRSCTMLAVVALACCVLAGKAAASPASVAPTPPMGWNSWDAFGYTIDEAQFKANAAVLAGLKSYGWTYAVIDEGWYMANPLGDKLETRHYLLDGEGRLQPVVSRFPSASSGRGLKPLADWTHAQGLKFGIHIIRGIPKPAVVADTPIAGSTFHAAQAADRDATCPWDDANYGIADNAAGQAYYDALIGQYAAWGVDFLKVDCIADRPYRPTEIRQIGEAIRKAGRPMVLSLSPGPAHLENAAEMAGQAQMWRIANDLWDGWDFPHAKPTEDFPNGVLTAFDNLSKWNGVTGPGRWPDADMLPFGSLRPHPGWGDPRSSRLSEVEARTAMTLWAIARSPLILGGDLSTMPAEEGDLVRNPDIIALNQRTGTSRPMTPPSLSLDKVRVWVSAPEGGLPDTAAVFNLTQAPLTIAVPWSDLGLSGRALAARELWTGARLPASKDARFTIPAHGAVVWRVEAAR